MDDNVTRNYADWMAGSIHSMRSPGTWRRRSLRNQKTWRRSVPEMPFAFFSMCKATLVLVLRECGMCSLFCRDRRVDMNYHIMLFPLARSETSVRHVCFRGSPRQYAAVLRGRLDCAICQPMSGISENRANGTQRGPARDMLLRGQDHFPPASLI